MYIFLFLFFVCALVSAYSFFISFSVWKNTSSKLKRSSMKGYLRTSASSHNDEQQPATPPVVSNAFCGSDNQTKAEGRQADVNFPSTTSRTDPPFFYPNKKSSPFHGNDSSKSTPLSSSDNGHVASDMCPAPVQSPDETDTIEVPTGEKMNGHYFQPGSGSDRRKVHNKEEKKKNESAPSKNLESVFFSLRQEMAQEERGDTAVGGMRVTTAIQKDTVNVESSWESSLTKDKEKEKSYDSSSFRLMFLPHPTSHHRKVKCQESPVTGEPLNGLIPSCDHSDDGRCTDCDHAWLLLLPLLQGCQVASCLSQIKCVSLDETSSRLAVLGKPPLEREGGNDEADGNEAVELPSYR